ncbi:cytochrome P450 [Arthrobacter sp. NamB2]|uniref:cytochrome P450 n=1 Tax=Arthrobacter sp. NamB2 TaxID=2576035 RepID=UPI0010C990D4|nr:cytochrome P450 [Arthrobacter sp. NamB2]TKV29966.1 cytochrome P450 [Arthrobacter sp. NamB2]
MPPSTLPTASALDTARLLLGVFLPTVAKGPIIRRPRVVGLAARLELDAKAVDIVRRVHAKYPSGPLMLKLPIRKQAVILAPDDVTTVLARSPEPFSPATSEKKAALSHFQPANVLISRGSVRTVRRALQEQVLDTGHPVHHLADRFVPIVEEEMQQLLADAASSGSLPWDDFLDAWYRVVRRVVFGDHARHDKELTAMVIRLRKDGNWAFLRPVRRRTRARFLQRISDELANAEPGSLAAVLAAAPMGDGAEPSQQVPQWLFAFDPAGMATFRTLAVLATHDEAMATARREVDGDTSGRRFLPYLRASVLESLRLWPTTPMILRQTTAPVEWDHGVMPAQCGILIYSPYFHRDDRSLRNAHGLRPERWLTDEDDGWPLVPFSDGPVVCPGKQLVLLLTSAALASLVSGNDVELAQGQILDPSRPLPGTMDNYSVRLVVSPRAP